MMSEETAQRIYSWLIVMAAALVGRMIYHAQQVQHGRRKFWSPALALDLIIALGMGLIGHALASYLGLTGEVEAGLVALAGYFGPHGLDALFNWKFGKQKDEDHG
jgi:LydA holin phage, holin superfamily III